MRRETVVLLFLNHEAEAACVLIDQLAVCSGLVFTVSSVQNKQEKSRTAAQTEHGEERRDRCGQTVRIIYENHTCGVSVIFQSVVFLVFFHCVSAATFRLESQRAIKAARWGKQQQLCSFFLFSNRVSLGKLHGVLSLHGLLI